MLLMIKLIGKPHNWYKVPILWSHHRLNWTGFQCTSKDNTYKDNPRKTILRKHLFEWTLKLIYLDEGGRLAAQSWAVTFGCSICVWNVLFDSDWTKSGRINHIARYSWEIQCLFFLLNMNFRPIGVARMSPILMIFWGWLDPRYHVKN